MRSTPDLIQGAPHLAARRFRRQPQRAEKWRSSFLSVEINIAIINARVSWYTAVITIVEGHIIAVYLAHLVALRLLGD